MWAETDELRGESHRVAAVTLTGFARTQPTSPPAGHADVMDPHQPLHPGFMRMAAHLERLAEQLLHTLTQPFGDESEAAADLHNENYDAAWGRPLFQYVHRIAPQITSVHDHMRATGALIVADRVVQAPIRAAVPRSSTSRALMVRARTLPRSRFPTREPTSRCPVIPLTVRNRLYALP